MLHADTNTSNNNTNHQTPYLEQYNSSIIDSIPTETIDDNNKELNYAKHF